MKIGIAADHGGYELKETNHKFLPSLGHEIKDFGAFIAIFIHCNSSILFKFYPIHFFLIAVF